MAQAQMLLAAEELERRRRVVLIVDEAHLLTAEQLEELRLLTNADMDATNPFVLLMVGQPMLLRRLKMGSFAALDQRLSTRYQVQPLDLAEAVQYLRHHLAWAGRKEPLFADDAVARLHQASLGLPRNLNNLARDALIAAAAAHKDLVVDVEPRRLWPSTLPTSSAWRFPWELTECSSTSTCPTPSATWNPPALSATRPCPYASSPSARAGTSVRCACAAAAPPGRSVSTRLPMLPNTLWRTSSEPASAAPENVPCHHITLPFQQHSILPLNVHTVQRPTIVVAA
jgi:AAA domain